MCECCNEQYCCIHGTLPHYHPRFAYGPRPVYYYERPGREYLPDEKKILQQKLEGIEELLAEK